MSTAAPTLEDVWRLFQETDRQRQESERQFREQRQESERQFREQRQETDRRFRETERLVARVDKQLGEWADPLGEFVKDRVRPAVIRLLRERGLEAHHSMRDIAVTPKDGGEGLEIDLLVVNDDTAIGVECKSKLAQEHIDRHLAHLGKLKRVLPLYREHRVMGAVAGMVVTAAVAEYAMARGLYVLCQNGDQVDVHNPPGFVPARW